MPVTVTPSTVCGPVQPFGERSTMRGQRGRVPSQSPPRAAAWMAVMREYAVASASAKRTCMPGRSEPSTSITS